MKKKVFGRKLSRERDSRRALFRSLIKNLVEHGKITTTKAKAKAIIPALDKIINTAKSKDISSRRRVYSFLANDAVTTDLLFGKVSEAFANKKSGFTRAVNLPRRVGDFAEMVRLEWTEKVVLEDKKEKKGKKSEVKEAETKKVKPTLKSRVEKIVKANKK